MSQPAFYARTGSFLGDLVTLLHLPYTAWHLAYVAAGAALAPQLDWVVLAGTLLAFAFGLGVGAHALDELHDRPLSTSLTPTTLRALGWGGLAAGAAMAVAAAVVISPFALVLGAVGALLAAAYALEWSAAIHSSMGFALSWGAFPVLVGHWAQTESLSLAAILLAVAATCSALVQRRLSTPARQLRRMDSTVDVRVGSERWSGERLIATWEAPLGWLAVAHVLVALALLAAHLPF